jgi:uncharacterized membrane-anchored protein YhcB (DUF1043 family)
VQISGSTFMLSGLEEFIVPQLEKWALFCVELHVVGIIKDSIGVILKKYLKPMVSNNRKLHKILNQKRNTFDPANKERRAKNWNNEF